MPVGMYAGKTLEEVPDTYLLWLWENKMKGYREQGKFLELWEYIEDSLDSIKLNVTKK